MMPPAAAAARAQNASSVNFDAGKVKGSQRRLGDVTASLSPSLFQTDSQHLHLPD